MGNEIIDKSRLTITAKDKWQKTGMRSTPLETIVVTRLSGNWCINPAVGSCDANGVGITAKEGYALSGAREGQLLGKIGDKVFTLGNQGETPEGLEGELELCANDDVDGRYGAGYADNDGEIEFELSLHRR